MARDEDTPEADRLAGAPHPRETTVLVGHAEAERTLLDAYRGGRMHHAWILAGPEGIGKATLAYRLARFALSHPDPRSSAVRAASDLSVDPAAPASRRIAAQAHTSLFVARRALNPERKTMPTEIPVDMVRKAVGFFGATAGEGGWRVCIVDAGDELNRSSANALLKALEEPPPRSLFVIVSHVPGRLLPTIRSRCRMLRLGALSEADVSRAVEAVMEVPAAEARVAAALGEGSVRRAIRMLDEGVRNEVLAVRAFLDALPELDWKTAHAIADRLGQRGQEETFELVLDAIARWLSTQVNDRAAAGAARLAPLAQVWDKIARAVDEADRLNLDKRALVLTLLSDLAAAARASRAA